MPLILLSLTGFTQNPVEAEYVVIVFDIERNDDLHPRNIFYWIAESNKVNDDYEHDFFPIFLKLFYPSSSYHNCCLGKKSYFYTNTKESKFDFTDDFYKKQKVFREFLKKHSKVLQVIKKQNKWNRLLNEKITISTICSCKIKEDRQFDTVFLPISDFKLNPEFWHSENASYVTNRDFSSFVTEY